MANKLSNSDYIAILKYYDIPLEQNVSKNEIKNMAEDILANKLCRCIKKVQIKGKLSNEASAIAICKDSVLHKKNIESGRFTCKKKAAFITGKKSREKLTKRNKKMKISRSSKKTRKQK